MPVIKCANGKWRVGQGQCIYDTKEKATEVYQAIIAQGKYAQEGNKVSFDFDDTLSTARGQALAKRLMAEGKDVHIITRRQESASAEVYKVAKELGIPRSKVHFTNGKMKWETIKRLGIDVHYDNNQDEISLIDKNTQAVPVKFAAEDSFNDYPQAASDNAKRALKWADENGWGSCGTPVGKIRANQLAKRESISRDTIARMASFKRHQQNKDVPYKEGCGGLMWDAWGGTEGIEWAIRKLEQIDK